MSSQHPIPGPGPAQDVFLPVGGGLPSQIPPRGDNPVQPTGVTNLNPNSHPNSHPPIATNKFYANFLLGDQSQPTWTHPYSVSWSKGGGNAASFGLAISHIDSDQKVLGQPHPEIPGSPDQYFFSPVGIQSIILSATELDQTTTLTTDSLKAFSVNVNLQCRNGPGSGSGSAAAGAGKITFTLLQGMGFVTGRYTHLQPAIQSSVFFRTFTPSPSPKPGVFKYQVTLEDNKSWIVYVTTDDWAGADPGLQLVSNTLVRGSPNFSGIIQVAKNPSAAAAAGEHMYDAGSGVYPTDAGITGSTTGATGQYTVQWTKTGTGLSPNPGGAQAQSPLVMFALPHHVSSFDSGTRSKATTVQLATTTKGNATAVLADSWTMVEPDLPVDMGFAPWTPGTPFALSDVAKAAVSSIAASEVLEDFEAQIQAGLSGGAYMGGKAICKCARTVYTVSALLGDTNLAAPGLAKLKSSFARVVNNSQPHPLAYDTVWKGVVSVAGYPDRAGNADLNADFGNTVYNDHHFHYGYWVHAAALIGHLDPSWLTAANKDYVNMLVRDYSNPVADDPSFPLSRSFDWYHGHSWAHGVTAFADGKDEESTSEDSNAAYAIKMWGNVVGDKSMEARGNLMLAVMARAFQTYFLMDSSNNVQPPSFIGNKVTGILFENKCDHSKWFAGPDYCIQGIQMLPLTPCSGLIRTKRFVQEEWDIYFGDHGVMPATTVTDGWKSILYQNLALVDPKASWAFFSQPTFNPAWLDDGVSRTWSLVFAAGLGGVS
ncbi:hypothetical protein A1O3_00584 [Capronia epimyces CBS 606.96]|uniref:glucan endo-1,3-beta-D-glucosidase n=1 Tax=Capronia epimyces CBS 606.96 TaxID=1182542 RepID=W9ZBZ7_9EURO|nr:uncharacterized protein A1O3_00584 [Capronia epimyces CBS 606.96]EXJ92034.1 hypothetical protein A1O3_00584 [Capronia epimyces CBS 606.96]